MRLPFMIFLILAAFVLACGAADGHARGESTSSEVEDLYRKYCTLCHGNDGKKGFNGAGDLTKSTLLLDERVVLIREGKGMMTPFRELLDEEQIRAVAEYTLKLKP
jgi:mono/diheme cytochrome c family protein